MGASGQVYTRVARVLAESLNADAVELTPAARLHADLGAESIDFLDIVFRLEREFGIRVPRDELFPESIFRGDPDFVQDGIVTDRGLSELRARMPYADLTDYERDRRLASVPDLFTVGMITQ
jgi:acyl carrier protein